MFEIEYFNHSSPLLDSQDCWHRVGISFCPKCGAEFDDYHIWERDPYLIQIIFEPKYMKKGYVITVSNCPQCNHLSWCHCDLDWMIDREYYDRGKTSVKRFLFDTKRLKKERKRIIQKHKDIWNKSLCKRCAVKKTVEKNKYRNHYVKCDGRWGPPSMPDEEAPHLCTSFKEKKKKKIQLIFGRCLECAYEGFDYRFFIKSGWVVCPKCKSRKKI